MREEDKEPALLLRRASGNPRREENGGGKQCNAGGAPHRVLRGSVTEALMQIPRNDLFVFLMTAVTGKNSYRNSKISSRYS